MVKLTCTIFGTSDGMGGGDTVRTYDVPDSELNTPVDRYRLRTSITNDVEDEIGCFNVAVVYINGDWVIVDQDDEESGIIAVVKIEGGL